MKAFISHEEEFKHILPLIIEVPELHCKWLNTLSYMENSGARKIAACEHPTLVREEILKHASEEFRHAHYLKRQIGRVSSTALESYASNYILGGTASLNYLNILDLKASRFLNKLGFSTRYIKEVSYLLVTYAIELRAGEMYPIYESLLRASGSRVTVRSILLEEKEHLNEMVEGLGKLPSGFDYAEKVCAMEGELCSNWIKAIRASILCDCF